jgi:hypothetical protein
LAAHEEGSYLCGQQKGNPGDILINGRDGNFLAIRRGGIVQIGAKPICQTLYFPIRNIIQHISENHEILSVAGDLSFEVLRAEDSSEGQSKCIFDIAVREYAQDEKEIIKLTMGALDDSNTFVLESRDKGGGNTKLKLSINKSGDVKWNVEGKISFSSKGDMNIKSDSTLSIEAKNDLKLKSTNGNFSMDGVTGKLHTSGNMDLKSDVTMSINGQNILLNNGSFNVVRNTPDFAQFLAATATAINTIAPGSVVLPILYSSPNVLA